MLTMDPHYMLVLAHERADDLRRDATPLRRRLRPRRVPTLQAAWR